MEWKNLKSRTLFSADMNGTGPYVIRIYATLIAPDTSEYSAPTRKTTEAIDKSIQLDEKVLESWTSYRPSELD